MIDREYYKSIATQVLRQMWGRLRTSILSLPEKEWKKEDIDALIAMRDELDRRSGGKPVVEYFDFEKYVTK